MSAEAVAVLEIEGKHFPLKAGRNYLVGRKTTAEHAAQLDIELDSQSLDIKHALIRVSDEETKILDLYSKFGTFLNNQRLDGLTEVTIGTTGRLQLGELVGSLLFNATLQSHDSSGFHDGPKNSSDIICSSPEPTTLSGSRLKHMQKNSLTSTPNGNQQAEAINTDEINTQCNFLIPTVPQRKSNASNTSRASLTGQETTLNSANNNSVTQQNKSFDSFCIPETQQYPGRPSLDKNSSRDFTLASSNADGDSLLNSRVNDDDQDFCIPETQDAVPAFANSEARKRFQAERAVLDANLPLSIFAEEDENGASSAGGSQFRICTQDFNEVDCFNDDNSNGSDLLADAPYSIVIPHIQHDAVMLNNSGKVLPSDGKRQSSQDGIDRLEDKEMSSLDWSAQGSTLHEDPLQQREASCTPELFDLPDVAQQLVNEANDIASIPCDSNSNTNESTKVPVEMPSTSFKAPTLPATKVSDLALFEDDDDLLPTQVFAAKPVNDSKKVTTGKCSSPEYLTLSDKENILPAAAAMLEAVDFMQPTQLFDFSGGSDDDQLLVPIATASTAATSTTTITEIKSTDNNAGNTPSDRQQPVEDDDDLLPTQVFPSTKSIKVADIKTPTVSSKFLSSTLKTTSEADVVSDAATSFTKMHQQTPPQTVGVADFLKPPEILAKKSSTLSNISMSESPDIDMLLCTPQIIAENFDKTDTKAKISLLDKQKTLFGDDSDEADDALELINAPKVSHDFDKLLPHLKKPNQSPKREEMDAEMHQYNRSFGERKEESKSTKSKEHQRQTTRNRDERHLERDKKLENSVKNDKKDEESKKKTRSRAATRSESEKKEQKEDTSKKSDRKRKNAEDTESEAEVKIVKKAEKQEFQKDKVAEIKKTDSKMKQEQKNEQNPVKIDSKETNKRTKNSGSTAKRQETTSKKEVSSSAEQEKVSKVKPVDIDKKETNKQLIKPRKGSATKIQQETSTASSKEITTRRKTRSRTQSQSSNSEPPVELPPRRLTRQKSRIDVEPIPEQTTAAEVKKKTRGKSKNDAEDQRDKDATPKEETTKKKKLTSSSSQSSCSSSKGNSQESKSADADKSDEGITATQERRKRLRSTTTLVSATHSSSSSSTAATTTTTTPDDASDAQKLRKPKKIQVSMTMVDPELFQNLAKNASDIWTVAKDPVESDILIMDKGNRTFKFLIAMAKGIPIVTSSWLGMVNKSRQIVSMTEHLYADEAFEKRHKFSLLKSIQMARKQKLFADYHFIMTPGIRPQPDEMEAIIKCAGGSVHIDVPALKDNQKLYLVTSKDDQKLWHKYRRLSSKISIISSEGVMAAVMRQVVKPLETNLFS